MDRMHCDWRLLVATAVALFVCMPAASRAEAGDGLRAGDLKLHPRLTLSGAYDQNVFRLNPDEQDLIGAPILGIEPGLTIETLDPTAVDFNFDAAAQWEQYLSSEERAQNQSGLNGTGGIGLTLNPEGGLSLTVSDDLRYTNDPTPYPGSDPYNRLVNRAGGKVGIHPGDKILNIGLGYKYSIYRYFTDRIEGLAKDSHDFQLDVAWRFLPKTALVLDGDAKLIRYRDQARDSGGGDDLPNVNSTPVHVQGGLSGLLSRRISTRLLAGYATGLYESGPTYYGPIGQADLSYKYGNLELDNKVSAGYKRSFRDSSVGNYFSFHRVQADWVQNFAQKRFGFSLGGAWTYRDYAPIDQQVRQAQGVSVVTDGKGRTVAIPDLFDNYFEVTAGIHSNFLKWWRAELEYTYETNATTNEIDIPAAGIEQLRSYDKHLILLSTTIHY